MKDQKGKDVKYTVMAREGLHGEAYGGIVVWVGTRFDFAPRAYDPHQLVHVDKGIEQKEQSHSQKDHQRHPHPRLAVDLRHQV